MAGRIPAGEEFLFAEYLPYYVQLKLCEGLILKKKGKGTFVSQPKVLESFVQKLSGFYEDMAAQNRPTHTLVLRLELARVNRPVARMLKTGANSKVILLKRLRFVDNDPIQLVSSYIPYGLCPELLKTDFTNRSLYGFLEAHGIFLACGYRTVGAARVTEEEARQMNVEAGTPMIRIGSIGYMDDGTPVEYYETVHRGDRTRFPAELVRERMREPKKRGYRRWAGAHDSVGNRGVATKIEASAENDGQVKHPQETRSAEVIKGPRTRDERKPRPVSGWFSSGLSTAV